MAQWLKRGATGGAKAETDRKVRDVVEGILGDIESRGDAALRELSIKFDGWDRDSYLLTDAETQECLDQLSTQDLKDIEFAQTQIRNFAQIQREALKDVEVETLPGVILGPQEHPGQRGRLLRAGRQVPDGGLRPHVASSPPRSRACRASSPARRRSRASRRRRSWRRMHLAGADEIYCLGGIQAIGAMALGTQSIRPVDMLVGPGNAYRGGSQAPVVRPGRHRPVRRPHRDAGDRRRERGRGALRHRPTRPGGARP